MQEKLIKKQSQCERVLEILQNSNGKWTDGMTFLRLDHPITQYHARIFELQEQGYNIESRFIEGKNWKEYKIIPRGTLF
jgi:hypothetical protein